MMYEDYSITKYSQFTALIDMTRYHSIQNKPSSFIVDSSCLSSFPYRLACSSKRCTLPLLSWIFPSSSFSLCCILSLSWWLVTAFRSSSSWDFSYKMNAHPLWDVSAETNEVGIHNCTLPFYYNTGCIMLTLILKRKSWSQYTITQQTNLQLHIMYHLQWFH